MSTQRNRRNRTKNRVRFSHNVEVRPRDHARIDVIGDRLGITNLDVVRELLDAYEHDRPMIALRIAAELPNEQRAGTGARIDTGFRGVRYE